MISKRLLSTVAMMAAVFSLLFSSLAAANSLKGLRVWPSPEETRVVIDLKSEADFSYFTLTSPNRLVVDLKRTNLATKLPVTVTDSPVLKKIRKSSPPEKTTYRLVFELKKSTKAEIFKLSPTPGGQYGHRLVIDLPHGEVKKSSSSSSSSSSSTVSKSIDQVQRKKDILIVIDPWSRW